MNSYTGRDMKTAHAGLVITEADWNAFMSAFGASLDAARVPGKEKAEALQLFTKLKPEIDVT